MNDFTTPAAADEGYHAKNIWCYNHHASIKQQQHWPACTLRVVSLDDAKNVHDIEKLFPSECFSLSSSSSESLLLTPFEYKPLYDNDKNRDEQEEVDEEDNDDDDELESTDSVPRAIQFEFPSSFSCQEEEETTLEGVKLIPLLEEDETSSVTSAQTEEDDDDSTVSSTSSVERNNIARLVLDEATAYLNMIDESRDIYVPPLGFSFPSHDESNNKPLVFDPVIAPPKNWYLRMS